MITMFQSNNIITVLSTTMPCMHIYVYINMYIIVKINYKFNSSNNCKKIPAPVQSGLNLYRSNADDNHYDYR